MHHTALLSKIEKMVSFGFNNKCQILDHISFKKLEGFLIKIVRQMSLSLMIGELIFISRDVLRTNPTISLDKVGGD